MAHRFAVASDFAHGGGDILDRTGVAGAVVGAGEIVVDRLGHANHAEFVFLLLSELGNLVGSILRIIAADVEEVADVVRLEDFEHALEILLALQLVAAGAEGRTRGVTEGANLLLRFVGEVDKVLV